MGDACGECNLDPKTTCPITRLYWAFLARYAGRLAGNQRLARPLRSVARRSAEERARDAATLEWVRATLARGERLLPAAAP